MKEHQKHTAFLKQCIRFDNTHARQQLEAELTQAQREERCLRRATWLMAISTALATAGLGYCAVLSDDFPFRMSQFASHLMVRIFFAIGAGSLFCLVVFAGLWAGYRRRLNRQHEECRRWITKFLELRLTGSSRPASPMSVSQKIEVEEQEALASQITAQPGAL